MQLYLKSLEFALYLIGCEASAIEDFYLKEEHDEISASGL